MKYGNENIVGERSGRSISPQFEIACQEVICEALVELMTQKEFIKTYILIIRTF